MEYLVVLDVLGIIAFAFTGYILAVKANFDIMGIFIISASNALGGGLIRDVIVGTTPFVFTNVYPLLVVLLTIVTSIIFKLHLKNNLTNNYIFVLADTVGLALFSVTGAGIGIAAGFNAGGIIFLGLLTTIGGGLIRDIILNEVPTVLKHEIYGSIAILISGVMWAIHLFIPITPIIIIGLIVLGSIVRLTVIKLDMHLPKIN